MQGSGVWIGSSCRRWVPPGTLARSSTAASSPPLWLPKPDKCGYNERSPAPTGAGLLVCPLLAAGVGYRVNPNLAAHLLARVGVAVGDDEHDFANLFIGPIAAEGLRV